MNNLTTIFAAIDFAVTQWLEPTLMIIMVVLGLAAIVVVMMQKSTSNDVGALSGETETYMKKSKGTSKESVLKTVTYVILGLILVTAITLFIILKLSA